MKIIKTIIYTVLIAFVAFIALASALSVFEFKGFRVFIVGSGSMEPTIKKDSLVLIQKKDSYQVGDIITFKNSANANIKRNDATTTHRIAEVKKDSDNHISFSTKGDANNANDVKDTPESLVLGTVIFPIPFLGKIISFAKTQIGFLVFIIIPATIIIYSELKTIKDEISKIFLSRKKPKDEEKE